MSKPGKANGNVEPLRFKRACPLCGKPSDRSAYPFCSTRCADIDLNRWLTGQYRIPIAEDDTTPSGDPETESET